VSRARLVRAANPSPMTLDGTNTWVLKEGPSSRAIVVDPGPALPQHFQAILDVAGGVGLVLLTHGHPDHAEGALEFARLSDAPIRAASESLCHKAKPLRDGEVIDVDGLRVEVLATPGHSADSTCFLLAADDALLTGDTILGQGSTVVAHPDGKLSDYLETLGKLGTLVKQRGVRVVLPGHGPTRDDPAPLVEWYKQHREARLDQVRAALAAGATTADQVVDVVYGEVDPAVKFAARWSVLAQLEYLGVTSPDG
jgi:glyoxylase-like metal-dependent hydrolase (beta-lactamase superfamily II)